MSPRRFGKVLKAVREEKGLTQVDVAKKANVTQAYIAKLEAGVKQNPSLTTLRRIARALEVPIQRLLR